MRRIGFMRMKIEDMPHDDGRGGKWAHYDLPDDAVIHRIDQGSGYLWVWYSVVVSTSDG